MYVIVCKKKIVQPIFLSEMVALLIFRILNFSTYTMATEEIFSLDFGIKSREEELEELFFKIMYTFRIFGITSSKKVNIQACANFVPSLVIGWQIIKSYQPITTLGTKFAHG